MFPVNLCFIFFSELTCFGNKRGRERNVDRTGQFVRSVNTVSTILTFNMSDKYSSFPKKKLGCPTCPNLREECPQGSRQIASLSSA